MAKAPKPGTTPNARAKKQGAGLIVGYGGNRWVFRPDGVSPKDVADLRRACGFGPRDVIEALQSGGGLELDQAGALVFLARRQCEGRWVTWDHATEGLTYATPLELEPEPAVAVAEADDHPE